MRKFLSSTAGATFNQETPNFTVNVRKDCLELVCKVNRGMYNELFKNPPFPAWKVGLNEVWN